MIPSRVSLLIISLLGCISVHAVAQETSSGLSVPVTISGELRDAGKSGETATLSPGFRAVVSPSLRFGPHWFLYAALDTHSSSYFPYETGVDNHGLIDVELMQAFVGYTRSSSWGSMLIKAGQISSAFGLFPIDYDDAKMALINPPLAYTANLPIRPDQLACGVEDIIWQTYDSDIAYHCGGSSVSRYGITPVTLYGLPSIELQMSVSRFDARLQITNASPANPHGLLSNSQHVEWTAGAGYTFAHAFHLGASGFTGSYLDNNLKSLLPRSSTLQGYPATGIGVDAAWSRGHWSTQGEWMHFRFVLPAFAQSPSESAAYAQVNRTVTPRVFAAARINFQAFGSIQDKSGLTVTEYTAPQQLYELTLGYRLNREQLIKVGGAWQHGSASSAAGAFWPVTDGYELELQLVTSFNAISKAFR